MEKLHGKNFIYNLFGPNANLHHKNLKALFARQNHPIKHPPFENPKLEGAAFSYVDGSYISNHLYTWCLLFRILNDHMFQRSPCEQKKDDVQRKVVMYYRHTIFFRKDTHNKYLSEIILFQKHI